MSFKTEQIEIKPIPPLDLHVDLAANVAVRLRAQTALLEPEEAELLAALIHHRTGASPQQLHHALYGHWSGAPAIGSDVFDEELLMRISRLRRAIRPLEAEIHSRAAGGYRLEIKQLRQFFATNSRGGKWGRH